MYRKQFILIDADNDGRKVASLDEARAALKAGVAPSAGGRLVEGTLAADIDANDPLIGDACAEALTAWCDRHNLPYLLRESGRPGGRHVIAISDRSAPPGEWAKLCRELARQYGVVVQDRTGMVMRLLTAPHRIGLPSPIIACTITPAIVMDNPRRRRRMNKSDSPPVKGGSGRSSERATADGDSSRSAQEYGWACAMARSGWSARQAWDYMAGIDGKSAALGEIWFRRYVWLPAVTTVAAEQGLTEDAAWELAQRACRSVRSRGRDFWRYWWHRAQADALTERPRRYRLPDDAGTSEAGLPPEIASELATVRAGLRAAIDTELATADPRRRRSVHAAVYALAYAIVTRGGSMSTRTIAEQALLDLTTVRAALATAVDKTVLAVTHRYSGGSRDCNAYDVGPAAAAHISAARADSSLTRCTTPTPTGTASLLRLRATHARARKLWALRNDALAVLAPGERLATSQHPAAKLLRSLWHQRKWWASLTPDEQRARRDARRHLLGSMHRSERSAWLDWLARRELIVHAVDRIATGNPEFDDPHTIRTAPLLTLHRGMADPGWRTRPSSTELDLQAA